MLAYLFWHRPAAGVERSAYERELGRFHRSLAHRPPSGLRGSAALRCEELPWLDGAGPGYEDWYLLDDWAGLGVLEQAAVARGHVSAHDSVAARSAGGAGGVYELVEGSADPSLAACATWVDARPGRERRSLAALLGDGIDPRCDSLWRRSLVLGPAPEYCVLAEAPPAGVGEDRLPVGWSARALSRAPVWAETKRIAR
ncbi:MAG TPA: hypothetical protein VN889_03040 [Solirubrobacteraceae bacterium]|nr:hypothetical protein [Solirubrobacteraceae bacterium]